MGSGSGTRKESLEVLFGEWVRLCLFGDWALLEKLTLCTPEKEWTPRAGEWERLRGKTQDTDGKRIFNIRDRIPGSSYPDFGKQQTSP